MTDGRLKALERLAEYPQRVERLKRLWVSLTHHPRLESLHSRTCSPPRSDPPPVPFGPGGSASPGHVAERRRDRSPGPAAAKARHPSPVQARFPHAERAHRTCRDSSPGIGPERPHAHSPGPYVAKAKAKAHVQTRFASAKAKARGAADFQISFAGPLTAAQIHQLMTRDLTPEDYELLLLLDEGVVKKAKTLSPETVAALPRASGSSWVNEACSICLCALEEDEDVRMLPTCGHLFHAPCAHRWLTSEKAFCPLCGQEETKQEKIMNMFRRFDTNSDGMIDVIDLQKLLKALDAEFWDCQRLQRIVDAADVNQDGQLNLEDFIAWLFGGVDPAAQAQGAPADLTLRRGLTRQRLFEVAEC